MTVTDDDPHGYLSLRRYADHLATVFDGSDPDAARLLRDAMFQMMPSELLGEIGLTLARLLAEGRIPEAEQATATKTLEDIRIGFRRVGAEPSF